MVRLNLLGLHPAFFHDLLPLLQLCRNEVRELGLAHLHDLRPFVGELLDDRLSGEVQHRRGADDDPRAGAPDR